MTEKYKALLKARGIRCLKLPVINRGEGGNDSGDDSGDDEPAWKGITMTAVPDSYGPYGSENAGWNYLLSFGITEEQFNSLGFDPERLAVGDDGLGIVTTTSKEADDQFVVGENMSDELLDYIDEEMEWVAGTGTITEYAASGEECPVNSTVSAAEGYAYYELCAFREDGAFTVAKASCPAPMYVDGNDIEAGASISYIHFATNRNLVQGEHFAFGAQAIEDGATATGVTVMDLEPKEEIDDIFSPVQWNYDLKESDTIPSGGSYIYIFAIDADGKVLASAYGTVQGGVN